MKITKENIIRHVPKSLIVAFCAFLGLIVNEWDSQRKTDKQVERSLNYIVEELQTNANALGNAIYSIGIRGFSL
jgi:dolichol kinase